MSCPLFIGFNFRTKGPKRNEISKANKTNESSKQTLKLILDRVLKCLNLTEPAHWGRTLGEDSMILVIKYKGIIETRPVLANRFAFIVILSRKNL